MSRFRQTPLAERLRQRRARAAQQAEAGQAAEWARLDKAVENSSEKNRNFFIAYLGLLIYVQAIVFSTTDSQLIVPIEGLKMPIIDLTVPLVGFYAVVPLFVIALHFNFLQNLESHHYKLMRWREAQPGKTVPRQRVLPFLFDYAILEQEGRLLPLVRSANSLLCYNLAPITLGLLLWRFTDRQDFGVTAWHYLNFVIDCYLAWTLRRALQDNEKPRNGEAALEPESCANPSAAGLRIRLKTLLYQSWSVAAHVCREFSDFLRDTRHYGGRGLFGFMVLLETLLTGLVATPDEFFVAQVMPRLGGFVQSNSRLSNWIMPRIVADPSQPVWQADAQALETAAKLAAYDDWAKYFHERGQGFRPATLNLRWADLYGQDLSRAQLFGAKLQGADLSNVQMQGADLRLAQMQGASLWSVQMQGADLRLAQMQGAGLSNAQMQGAGLSNAQMQGADLWVAQMQGADLSGAQMQGADLSGAKMQGADLSRAEMQGVILGGTAIHSVRGEPKAAVFGPGKLFDAKMFSWSGLEKQAENIPYIYNREQYLQRIRFAAQNARIAAQNLRYAPTEITQAALPAICQEKGVIISDEGRLALAHEDHLAAAQSFRRRYISLRNNPWYGEEIRQNPDYPRLLEDIDRKLCTLQECADLRDKIDGLDCKNIPKPPG